MSISDILKKYHKIEIELLLGHVLRKSKEFVFLHPETRLTARQLKILASLIARRKKGEPVAYILGYKDFYGLKFRVNKDVLVPRPETEMVVDLVKRLAGTALEPSAGSERSQLAERPRPFPTARPIRILDLGTGSGNIIISLAKVLGSKAEYFASDISEKALRVARQNARTHKAKVKFYHSDILENVRVSPDIIIANLPYGWKAWKRQSSAETAGLKFEPQEALFTGENGLHLYRRLLEQVAVKNNPPKFAYLEFDPRQKAALARLIKKTLPGSKAEFFRDYAGRWRYAGITTVFDGRQKP